MVLGALLTTLGGILLPKITDAAMELGGEAINSGFKWLGSQLGFNYNKRKYQGSNSVGHRLMGLGRGVIQGKYSFDDGLQQAQQVIRGNKRRNPFKNTNEGEMSQKKIKNIEVQDLVPMYKKTVELDID